MYEYKAYVERVVDGDTVDLAIDLGFHTYVIKRVRLININAPERFTEEGKLAKAFVESVLAVGMEVVVKTKLDSNDKYGRVLGEIFIDKDFSLNEMLLMNGLASPYKG
jgi:endonuclease YncB( thermonuclease family)